MRRVITGALIAAGLLLIALGVQQWCDAHAARKAALRFLRAVEEGRREEALSLLTPARRAEWEASHRTESDLLARPEAGLSYRVHHVEVRGGVARADLRIEKGGYEIKPSLYLARGESTTWKVDRVENLEADRRWEDALARYGRMDGEALADELREALRDCPGVEVSRQ